MGKPTIIWMKNRFEWNKSSRLLGLYYLWGLFQLHNEDLTIQECVIFDCRVCYGKNEIQPLTSSTRLLKPALVVLSLIALIEGSKANVTVDN